ncbi:hypothetical protein [Rummeliibacillus stabekisii]|uniref:hypothetical protein n=1 Tax=Rummeliibacillus stabekisii TaxID=241244 RepID=UPI00371DA4E9
MELTKDMEKEITESLLRELRFFFRKIDSLMDDYDTGVEESFYLNSEEDYLQKHPLPIAKLAIIAQSGSTFLENLQEGVQFLEHELTKF